MPSDVVLVDSDVLGMVVLVPRDRDPRVEGWRRLLLGKRLVIAAQTEAEVRYGALAREWGPARVAALEAHLQRTPTLPVTRDVIRTFAAVRDACRRDGHPLSAKEHMGDAWIAATAASYGFPLLSGDAIYRGVLGLELLDAPQALPEQR